MGRSKSQLFSENQNKLATMARALAHPARIAILEMLIKDGGCVCGEIVDKLPLSQATVSQHLKAMKQAGILKGEIDGGYRCYCVDEKQCAVLKETLNSIFKEVRNCC